MINDEIKEYDYLWGKEKYRYVLLKVETEYCIIYIDQKDGDEFLLIEDDDIADAVIKKMIKCGNEICETIDELESYKKTLFYKRVKLEVDDGK